MTSPHHQGKIPWHCLTDHVGFDGSTGFTTRPASQIDSRKKAFAHFARDLASLIVDATEDELSLLPKPNASRDAWRDVGVEDNALFPGDLVDAFSTPRADGPKFHELQYWERHDSNSFYDARFILMVLTNPPNPFRHIAPLIYLAQHPRVMLRLHLKNIGPGLHPFASLTMTYYLLLNLVLALDSGASFDQGITRASLFHHRFENSIGPRRIFSLNADSEDLHTAFWYSAAPEYQDPDLRAAYSLRCFRLLVASYAILKETTLRDVAIGLDPYFAYVGKGYAFDQGTLVDIICGALNKLSPVFSDLEPSLVDLAPAKLPRDPSASQRQSRFVALPIEIHQYIYSFLPASLQILVNLAATCNRLREICTPLIYVEPFAAPSFTRDYRGDSVKTRSAALVKVLSSTPHLASHIRRLSVHVEGICDASKQEYPPLHLCLADMFTHLVDVNLYVSYECDECAAWREATDFLEFNYLDRITEAIAAVTRRWPNLVSLSLHEVWVAEPHWHAAPTSSPTPAVVIPQNLEEFVMSYTYVMPLALTTQKALLKASSHTLRHLVLHIEQVTMHDLPAFPCLERLRLTTGLSIKYIRLLLRQSFSSARFLSLGTKTMPGAIPEEGLGLTFDLSGIFDNLNHLHVTMHVSHYILPPSVKTVWMETATNCPSISVTTGSPPLAALCFAAWHIEFVTFLDSLEERRDTFQIARSLQIGMTAEVNDLPRVGEIIAAWLPRLEILILQVPAFGNRPRREDYPKDDGLDDVQKAAAVSLFEKCPGLNTVSFNGVPDIWDPIGRFPARVWTRDSRDRGGARMTGRTALPWKVDEIWGRYGRTRSLACKLSG
ncbi:hypothetical protein CPB85DRAFT_1325232 [Mucidula mucida]|nr:hypothetical protein CPB85DRAFT_1325232 [Mucidula mucida]